MIEMVRAAREDEREYIASRGRRTGSRPVIVPPSDPDVDADRWSARPGAVSWLASRAAPLDIGGWVLIPGAQVAASTPTPTPRATPTETVKLTPIPTHRVFVNGGSERRTTDNGNRPEPPAPPAVPSRTVAEPPPAQPTPPGEPTPVPVPTEPIALPTVLVPPVAPTATTPSQPLSRGRPRRPSRHPPGRPPPSPQRLQRPNRPPRRRQNLRPCRRLSPRPSRPCHRHPCQPPCPRSLRRRSRQRRCLPRLPRPRALAPSSSARTPQQTGLMTMSNMRPGACATQNVNVFNAGGWRLPRTR